ncbi:cytochrome c biogenesis fc [Trifolium pratense]|uniref:Cytochrome c biogenesis fc n=1 Tax=Trifolium pratense TaxID=57577 RepID=A0A2K3LNM6_TRIPR|nr:cytochrome c biogenesis fc [Trifolium pratense]
MDGAKSGVLVRASRPILLPDIIGRSSSETRAGNASFRFVPVLHFLLIESKGDFSYLESFCGRHVFAVISSLVSDVNFLLSGQTEL